MNYNQNKEKLLEVLEQKFDSKELENRILKMPKAVYFIKGDVSGIQDFIFTIPSKGAAKELKARSEKIRKETEAKYDIVSKKLKNPEKLYVGGGNFFLFASCENEIELQNLKQRFIEDGIDSFYIALTWVEVEESDLQNIAALRTKLEIKSGEDKLQKFKTAYQAFDVKPHKAKQYAKSDLQKKLQVPVWNNKLMKEYADIIVEEQSENQDEDVAVGNIITFNYLAEFAKKRTGTAKIGILKIDVDNLGKHFEEYPQVDENEALSSSLNYFFDSYVNELRSNGEFGTNFKFSDNIYVVFSGGDDCFFIGGWDAVFEFAKQVRQSFGDFTNNKITLSASLLVLSPHYPVIRFAEYAEDELHRAKHFETDRKDKISVMGEILSWEEFFKANDLKEKLLELINEKGESRAILEKIKRSSIGYRSLQERSMRGEYDFKKVWRLAYYLRDVKKANRDFVDKNIIREYENCLFEAFKDKKRTNEMLFPIAARWAELLSRKSN